MAQPIRVLVVEDSEDDTLLLLRALERAGFAPVHTRVETAEEMRAALADKAWDIVLADHRMPRFSAPEALSVLLDSGQDIPFIVVSAVVPEETAVELMRAGARDFVPKQNPARLVPAVQRELREAEARRRARKAAAAAARLAAIVESADEGILAMSLDGTITAWNPGAERLYGYAAAEILGCSVLHLMPPERHGELQCIREMVDAGRVTGPFDTVRLRKDGHELRVSLTAAPIRDSAGQPTGISWIARDISQRLRDIDALRRNARRAVFLAEAGSALASSLDTEQTLARIAQLAVPELADFCIVDLLAGGNLRQVAFAHSDPAQEEMLREMRRHHPFDMDQEYGVPKVLRTGEPLLVPVVTDNWKDSIPRDAEHREILRALAFESYLVVPIQLRRQTLGAISLVSTTPGRHYDGDDLALAQELATRAALAIDNARLYEAERKAKAEAEEANHAKDQFLALVSHELRNPLSAITTGTELLRQSCPAEGRAGRALEIVERNAKLQARLVNDILDLSRLQRDKLLLQRAPVELSRVVLPACQSVQAGAEDAALTLTCRADADLWVYADVDRLQQVLMNLLANAIKFTPPPGAITVSASRAQDRARVEVADTGIGISPHLIPTLFKEFFQGEIAGQRAAGLGLGLALVKGIVERHGGHVWAESEGVGQGSRFIVELPLAAPPARAPEAASPPREHPRILLVEDNADTRTMLAETLSLSGYDVRAAGSGEEALAILTEAPPDAMLVDIGLPGIDGFEFLRRARALPGMAGVPAFAVTGYGAEEDVRRGRQAGFLGHFVKPVDTRTVEQRLRDLLGLAPKGPFGSS